MSRPTLITLGSVLLGSFLIFPTTCFAQKRTGPAITSPERRETMLGREADLQNRAITLELLREPGKTKVLSADDRKFILRQIFEDFERVQVVNKEMIQASSNLDNNAYKRISSLADEMNKRAKRLKTNLNIPDLENDNKEPERSAEMDASHLRTSVQTLNTSVKSFVNSPVFTNPKVTTVGHLQNLRRDITAVIDLSRTVKKAAAKLED